MSLKRFDPVAQLRIFRIVRQSLPSVIESTHRRSFDAAFVYEKTAGAGPKRPEYLVKVLILKSPFQLVSQQWRATKIEIYVMNEGNVIRYARLHLKVSRIE
jgi:hypothetical protein